MEVHQTVSNHCCCLNVILCLPHRASDTSVNGGNRWLCSVTAPEGRCTPSEDRVRERPRRASARSSRGVHPPAGLLRQLPHVGSLQSVHILNRVAPFSFLQLNCSVKITAGGPPSGTIRCRIGAWCTNVMQSTVRDDLAFKDRSFVVGCGSVY